MEWRARFSSLKGTFGRAAFLTSLLALGLAACDSSTGPGQPGGPNASGLSPEEAALFTKSEALRAYYARVQASKLNYGLLRTDGGGIDTPYSGDMLLRNLEQLAFRDEVARNQARGEPQALRRWQDPIRIRIHEDAQRSDEDREHDQTVIRAFADRLKRITEHPISVTAKGSANFHIFLTSEMSRAKTVAQIEELEPSTTGFFSDFLMNMSRNTHCVVIVYGEPAAPDVLRSAVVLIRTELPPLTRRSCVHEEITQGLGILNDSPSARPSIFNDDDEFALLTSHDEALLRLLYDPRLRAGMPFEQVRPIVADQAKALAQHGASPS